MQVIVKGKNLEITDALRDHASQKVSKVGKLGLKFDEIEVKLVVEKNPSIKDNQIAEITATGNGPIFRATDQDSDMYTAIDKAVAKLQRQIKKFHGKQIDKSHHGGRRRERKQAGPQEHTPTIVKTKAISLKPMTPEEATLQMEMLGHDFFVFRDSETDNTNVVYLRQDGNYGLIDTSS